MTLIPKSFAYAPFDKFPLSPSLGERVGVRG
jgi:hypothetical protein